MVDHTLSAFGLTIHKNAHPAIRKLKRQLGSPSIHGHKFWSASMVLMDYLSEVPINRGAKVLELGCGYGLSGIYCAKHFEASVHSLDADEAVFPFLRYHAELNDVQTEPWQARYEALTEADLAQFDVIIAADICFWDDMSDLLKGLLAKALQAGVSRIVLADPGRPPFHAVAEHAEKAMGAGYFEWYVNHPHNVSGYIVECGS